MSCWIEPPRPPRPLRSCSLWIGACIQPPRERDRGHLGPSAARACLNPSLAAVEPGSTASASEKYSAARAGSAAWSESRPAFT